MTFDVNIISKRIENLILGIDNFKNNKKEIVSIIKVLKKISRYDVYIKKFINNIITDKNNHYNILGINNYESFSPDKFSPEQIQEIDDFVNVVEEKRREKMKQRNFDANQFVWSVQAAFRTMFKDYVAEGIFSQKDEENALNKVLNELERK